MQNKITEFKGDYRFLSNFFPVEIEHAGRVYQSVEHAYVASKCNSNEWKEFCSNIEVTAGQVKRAGKDKKLGKQLREDWQDVKLDVMFQLLCKKFAQEPFKTKLQETDDKVLEEGNYHGDDFWGICLNRMEGKNHLGVLLMNIRFRINAPVTVEMLQGLNPFRPDDCYIVGMDKSKKGSQDVCVQTTVRKRGETIEFVSSVVTTRTDDNE